MVLQNYDFSLKAIASRTQRHADDFDTSRPNPNRTDRLFIGSQLTYKGLRKHYPYVFALIQEDENREDPDVPFQDFDYNTQYYGIGIYGDVIPNLRYWGEFMFQTGTTFGSFATDDRDDIDAQALNVGFEYYGQARCRPKFSVEYGWAEGDKDRKSVTETMFGNVSGTNDTQFSDSAISTPVILLRRFFPISILSASEPLFGRSWECMRFSSAWKSAQIFSFIGKMQRVARSPISAQTSPMSTWVTK